MQLPSKTTESSLAEINIVPLVDVVLVLLIIFIITAPILQSGIEVDLPKTADKTQISDVPVVVTIDRAEQLYIGNDTVNIHDLGTSVRAHLRDASRDPVYLRSDEKVPFGKITMVLDYLKQAGIGNVQLVTEPLSERPKLR